jgi:hypothetical protein
VRSSGLGKLVDLALSVHAADAATPGDALAVASTVGGPFAVAGQPAIVVVPSTVLNAGGHADKAVGRRHCLAPEQ